MIGKRIESPMAKHNLSQSEERSNEMTSDSLIDGLKNNQKDAWQRLYRLYEPLVRFWCHRANVPEQEIPDLVQEVFQTVAKSIASFSARHSCGSFRGWLRTITNSRVIDWRRRIAGKPTAVGGSTAQGFFANQPFDAQADATQSESDAEHQLIQQMHANALNIIRTHFQERTWRAFWRVVVDGMTPKEAGIELDMQPGAVRVAKSRVLYRLRAELGEVFDGE